MESMIQNVRAYSFHIGATYADTQVAENSGNDDSSLHLGTIAASWQHPLSSKTQETLQIHHLDKILGTVHDLLFLFMPSLSRYGRKGEGHTCNEKGIDMILQQFNCNDCGNTQNSAMYQSNAW